MKFIFTSILVCVLSIPLNGQTRIPENFQYLVEAIERNIEGKVYVQFTAIPSGEILDSTIQVVKVLGFGLDEVAIEVVRHASPLGRNYVTQLKKDEPTKLVLPLVFTILPKHWASYYFEKGIEQHELGNFSEAVEYFTKSISLVNSKEEYFYSLYKSLKKLDKNKGACSNLKKATKIDKSFADAWANECK